MFNILEINQLLKAIDVADREEQIDEKVRDNLKKKLAKMKENLE